MAQVPQGMESVMPNQGAHVTYRVNSNGPKPDLILKSYHISCLSDKVKSYENPGKEYGGVVIYQKDGKDEWELNSNPCWTGYVIVKDTKKLEVDHIESHLGQVHGKVYKSVFGPCDAKVVGGGFAYYQGKWRFNSDVFNLRGEMSETEKKYLIKALKHWCKDSEKNHTYQLEHPLNIYITEKKYKK